MSSGLDMVAAAAQVVAKVREEEDEREGKAISVGAAAAATAAGASMAAALGPRHPVVRHFSVFVFLVFFCQTFAKKKLVRGHT